MIKSDYTYRIDHEQRLISIIDLNQGNMSVTNNTENVLTEIRQNCGSGSLIEVYEVVYNDSDGNWDTIIPTWAFGKCIATSFKQGIPLGKSILGL